MGAEALQGPGFSRRVNTACIERVNLTIRRGIAALARRTWATALQTPIYKPICSGGRPLLISFALMPRCVWPRFKDERGG